MSPRSRALPLLALTLLVSPVLAQQGTTRKPSQAALYAKFARTMTNATLVGVFTDSSAPEGSGPHEESYTLGRVAKIGSCVELQSRMVEPGGTRKRARPAWSVMGVPSLPSFSTHSTGAPSSVFA